MYLPVESGIEKHKITEIVRSPYNLLPFSNSPFLSTFSTRASPPKVRIYYDRASDKSNTVIGCGTTGFQHREPFFSNQWFVPMLCPAVRIHNCLQGTKSLGESRKTVT